jgi:hypothetical protein
MNNSNRDKAEDIELWVAELVSEHPLLLRRIQANTPFQEHDELTQSLTELVRFLYLCSVSKTTLTPSKLIDAVWHEFILFTKSYSQFCSARLDGFIHHQPSSNSSAELGQYHQTLAMYQQYFGECNSVFWPKPQELVASCGPCEGGSA